MHLLFDRERGGEGEGRLMGGDDEDESESETGRVGPLSM